MIGFAVLNTLSRLGGHTSCLTVEAADLYVVGRIKLASVCLKFSPGMMILGNAELPTFPMNSSFANAHSLDY